MHEERLVLKENPVGDGYLGEADCLASFDSVESGKDAEERHHWKSGIRHSQQGK